MAAEESDLQFIRCPSCRSLVPAVATRCRMCGQILETPKGGEAAAPANSADDSADALARKSRVRQRTMSVSEDERDVIKEQLTPKPSVKTRDTASDFDPESFPVEAEEDTDDEVIEEADEIVGAGFSDRSVSAPFAGNRVTEPKPVENSQANFDADDDSEEDVADDDEELGDATPDHVESGDVVDPQRRRKRKRRRKKKGAQNPEFATTGPRPVPAAPDRGASQGAGMMWRKPEVVERDPAPSNGSVAQPSAPAPAYHGSNARPPMSERSAEIHPPLRHERTGSSVSLHMRSTEPTPAPRASDFREPSSRQESEAVVSTGGDLVGWLVTFTDGHANSRELRGGRFFVSREKLRPTDLVFPHPSVSMPQCLLTASTRGGISVQDLMSEHGTYLRRFGTENFLRVEDEILVGHGDSLRFGKFEVLVCLVPSGAVR